MTSHPRPPRFRPGRTATALALTLLLAASAGCGTEPAPDARAAGPSAS
ncbi:hypothetical protein G3I63_34470, partial [Streptomyces sp. SID8016]|nr:hypothetical protein [Streptomyces sp. SID8016]